MNPLVFEADVGVEILGEIPSAWSILSCKPRTDIMTFISIHSDSSAAASAIELTRARVADDEAAGPVDEPIIVQPFRHQVGYSFSDDLNSYFPLASKLQSCPMFL